MQRKLRKTSYLSILSFLPSRLDFCGKKGIPRIVLVGRVDVHKDFYLDIQKLRTYIKGHFWREVH